MIFFGNIFFQRIAELEKQLQEARNDLLRREKVITQLRLRMPATADRDRLVASVSASVYSAPPGGEPVRDYEGEHALKVAHSTLASLQVFQRFVYIATDLREFELENL